MEVEVEVVADICPIEIDFLGGSVTVASLFSPPLPLFLSGKKKLRLRRCWWGWGVVESLELVRCGQVKSERKLRG